MISYLEFMYCYDTSRGLGESHLSIYWLYSSASRSSRSFLKWCWGQVVWTGSCHWTLQKRHLQRLHMQHTSKYRRWRKWQYRYSRKVLSRDFKKKLISHDFFLLPIRKEARTIDTGKIISINMRLRNSNVIIFITKKSKALSWKTGRSGFLNSTSRLQKPESGSFFSVLEMLKKSFTYI